jgi:hypothetical protein
MAEAAEMPHNCRNAEIRILDAKGEIMITRRTCLAIAAGLALAHTPALAQQAARPPQQDPALVAAIQKSNAYIGLMNRTLRASQSLERYASWVNMKSGPTGREPYISYGLYSLYDVRSEIEKAKVAMGAEPKSPELDAAIERYIAAYQTLAPIITQAYGYYERQDYKADKMVPAGETFLQERAKLDALMKTFKRDLDKQELAAIDALEGRKARYHVKAVMIGAQEMMEFMPSNAKPVVDMAAFDPALARFASVVRDFDAFNAANPGAMSGFDSFPARLLGKLRDFQTKLQRAKGDARRGAGQDVTWIVNDYNMMISMSQTALRFSR